MIDIVLIIPPSPWLISDTDIPMLGILYISAYLKQKKYNVIVCDLSGKKEEEWMIPNAEVYGITGSSPQYIYMKAIINKIRKENKNVKIIAGGIHASTCPSQLLEDAGVDSCVVGEGELSMLNIMKYGIRNKIEKSTLISDIDTIPFPDRDIIGFEKYLKVDTFKYLIGDCLKATMITSRGCPYDCSFCASNYLWKGIVRYHSIKRVIEEILLLKLKYGIKLITFNDDTFILNKFRVIELSKKLKKLGIYWHCLGRVDICNNRMFNTMREGGCLEITFGFESGSDKILQIVNKKTSVEQAYKAVKAVKAAGMKVRGQMIIGLPGETDETIEQTVKFIRKLDVVDTFGIHVFQPFPGCEIWKNPTKFNYKINKNTNFFNYHTIGKRGKYIGRTNQVYEWFKYVKSVVKNRNIDEKIEEYNQ